MGIYNPGSGGSSPGGVTQIVAGTGISVNNGGIGVVTVTNTIPAGLTTLPTNNVVYVMKNGNDGTGLRNRLDKPFLTIGAGAAALQAGDTLWVFPGEYLPTSTINITNCNVYLQDAIIDYGFTHAGPLFNLSGSGGLYGTGDIHGSPPSGVALIQTAGSRYIFLKKVGQTKLITIAAACPIFSVTGNLTAEIYQGTDWNGFPTTNGLFQFGSTSTGNRFYYKSPVLNVPTKLNSNFKGRAQIQIDNLDVPQSAAFEFASGATGTMVIKNTAVIVDGSGGQIVYIDGGATPTVILWNTVTYITSIDTPAFVSVYADVASTPVYFYGVNQSNYGLFNIDQKVGTMTVDTNLIFPTF